jgi:hypothetical protein
MGRACVGTGALACQSRAELGSNWRSRPQLIRAITRTNHSLDPRSVMA